MQKDLLKQIIADQHEYLEPSNFFERIQTQKLLELAQDPCIIIISGMRRSGKSTVQRLLQTKLLKSDYYFNFDDERLVKFHVSDFQMLFETLIEIFGKQKILYFDEIQNIEGWESFVRRLYEKGYKIFITGSNAKLLSKELGTHLTGRYIKIEMYPLSFKEIVKHTLPDVLDNKLISSETKGAIMSCFGSYMKYGGIPDYYKFRKTEYLKDLYEGILYRDIVARYNISDEKALKELVYYFASNIGKEFSYSKLAKLIGLSSSNTISSYCSYLENCYLCFFLTRYSHSLKKQILHNKKCYMVDTGLINIIGFRVSDDKGRILENIVFMHLKGQSRDVYFHKDTKECDFVIREQNLITQAIQVCTSLDNLEVKKREVEGLLEALECYNLDSGLILTEDEDYIINYDRFIIHVKPIWKWLLDYS